MCFALRCDQSWSMECFELFSTDTHMRLSGTQPQSAVYLGLDFTPSNLCWSLAPYLIGGMAIVTYGRYMHGTIWQLLISASDIP